MEIKTLVTKAHENAVKHGFWEPPLPFGTAIALIHSELSEALEEERNGNPDIWFACNESDNFICTPQDETECLMYGKESLCKYRSRKPEGVAVELADAVIRIADLCGHLGIDLEEVIEKERPSRRSPWPSTAVSIATRPTISILSRGARLPNSSRSTSPKASASQSSEAYRPDPGKITTVANTRPSKSSPILSILRTPKRKAPPEATPKAP